MLEVFYKSKNSDVEPAASCLRGEEPTLLPVQAKPKATKLVHVAPLIGRWASGVRTGRASLVADPETTAHCVGAYPGDCLICDLDLAPSGQRGFLFYGTLTRMEKVQVPQEETVRDEPEGCPRGERTGRMMRSLRLVASILRIERLRQAGFAEGPEGETIRLCGDSIPRALGGS